jgi:hypothetical protein
MTDKYEINIPECIGPDCVATPLNIKKFQHLRNGSHWRQLTNDAVILRLCQRIKELEEQLNGQNCTDTK